jgi:hypothetical protein
MSSAAFGLNKPFMYQDEFQAGSLIELLKLPTPQLKLCQVNGRQVSVRDLQNSDKMSFVPIKEPCERITCMSSAYHMDRQVLAVAFTEGENEETVSVQVFNTHDPDKIVALSDRMRFKLPKIEVPVIEKQPTGGSGCEFHEHKPRGGKPEPEPQVVEQAPSWISQLTFSHNLNYLACLISGGLNGVLIYEW